MLQLIVLLGVLVASCGPEYPFEYMDVEEVWCFEDTPHQCVYIRYKNTKTLKTATDVELVSTQRSLTLKRSSYVPRMDDETQQRGGGG